MFSVSMMSNGYAGTDSPEQSTFQGFKMWFFFPLPHSLTQVTNSIPVLSKVQ